jgi:hypothetical protein
MDNCLYEVSTEVLSLISADVTSARGYHLLRYMYKSKELIRSKRESVRKLKEEIQVLQQKLER